MFSLGTQFGGDEAGEGGLGGADSGDLGEDVESVDEDGLALLEAFALLQLVIRHCCVHHEHGCVEPKHLVAVVDSLQPQQHHGCLSKQHQ